MGLGDAEVGGGGAFDGVLDFGFAVVGEDFEVVVFEGLAKPVGVVGEFEVPVFFFDLDDFSPLGTEFAVFVAFFVGEKLFLADGVVSGVGFFVELSFVVEFLEDFLDAGFVAFVGGGGPAIVVEAEGVPEVEEFFGDFFGVGGGVDAFFFGRLLDFLAVLVDAGEEVGGVTVEFLVAGEDVGENFFVGVADVGSAVGVVDGGGDEHGRGKGFYYPQIT